MSSSPNDTCVDIRPAGQAAWLVQLPDLSAASALHRALLAAPLAGVRELIPAARTLLVAFDALRVDAQSLRQTLAARVQSVLTAPNATPNAAHESTTGDIVEIPVTYNGEDLSAVAELLGVSTHEVIARHTDSLWLAAFAGFAPGFVYLTQENPSPQTSLHVPRRSSPRTRVPAGSVAIAGEFSAVYPRSSPGGWQLLGTTAVAMWDLQRTQRPAWVQPGQRVRFVDAQSAAAARVVSLGTAPAAAQQPAASNSSGRDDDSAWTQVRVLDAGLQTLFQDAGRAGQAALGISPAGALDMLALRQANRLVGNPVHTPVLENLLGQLHLQCERGSVTLAVAGADVPLRVRDAAGREWDLPSSHAQPQAIALDAGATLMLDAPRAGLRAYVAVRGGWDVQPVLGSASTDTLAELGPPPVQSGQCLRAGRAVRSEHLQAAQLQTVPSAHEAPQALPRAGDVVRLPVTLGPRADWFTPQAIATLTTQIWQVSPQSSRVGMRLVGETPLQRSRHEELPSEGVATGSVQVPANGQPVLFLADRPVTGGYPVIAVLHESALALAAQIPPGAAVQFVLEPPTSA